MQSYINKLSIYLMKVIKIVIIIIINDDENINGNCNNNDNDIDNNNRKTHSSSEIWTGLCIRYPLSSKDATSRALKRGYGESPVKKKKKNR